jgi:hypothetical protein
MKLNKLSAWGFLILLLASGVSCKKALNNINDYYPQVTMASAILQPDSSVIVKASLVADGAAPVDYYGFCCGTSPKPSMSSRQFYFTPSGPNFTATYRGLSPDSTYYFTAWATNSYGYVYSKSIAIVPPPIPPVTPPCTIAQNYVDLGNGPDTYTVVSKVNSGGGQWTFNATTASGATVNFTFGSALATGIYTTNGGFSPGVKQMIFNYTSGSISASCNGGSAVYVNQLSPGVYDMTICNESCWDNSMTFQYQVKMHMKIPSP